MTGRVPEISIAKLYIKYKFRPESQVGLKSR